MSGGARLGADIGGTFTDVVLEAGGAVASAKVLTTHAAPEEGVVEGLHRVCREAGLAPSRLAQVIHGTTLATNALIERRGARTALVTTEGFRDVIEMRTESRFEQYDLNLRLPEPLIPRQRRLTVVERIDARGRVLIPLGDLDALLDALERGRYESVAVGLLHSYANPAHERAVRDAIAARLPGVSVSISSEVSPQMREYERFSTVCADAYVKPLIGGYLRRLEARLAEAGARCPVLLMHSGGGIMALDAAAELPVRLVESGPAGGAIFAAHLAARHALPRALGFDMGGTTAKLCLIRDAAPRRARVFEVARSTRFKKGSGMPVSIPVIDMVEIGAGGGSLASLDAMGRVAVGPRSAGSEPGPACYGRGGRHPAVTDADLTLGRLDPERFAGGSIALSPQAASEALAREVGEPLGLDAATAALAVAEMVDEAMASAARVHAVEQGEDPAAYAMIAFGGAAPLHAARLCETLGIERFLVPPGAGVGSALGFLRAPAAFEATRSHVMRLSAWDERRARAVIDALTEEARAFVARCGPGRGDGGRGADGGPGMDGDAGAGGGLKGRGSDGGGRGAGAGEVPGARRAPPRSTLRPPPAPWARTAPPRRATPLAPVIRAPAPPRPPACPRSGASRPHPTPSPPPTHRARAAARPVPAPRRSSAARCCTCATSGRAGRSRCPSTRPWPGRPGRARCARPSRRPMRRSSSARSRARTSRSPPSRSRPRRACPMPRRCRLRPSNGRPSRADGAGCSTRPPACGWRPRSSTARRSGTASGWRDRP